MHRFLPWVGDPEIEVLRAENARLRTTDLRLQLVADPRFAETIDRFGGSVASSQPSLSELVALPARRARPPGGGERALDRVEGRAGADLGRARSDRRGDGAHV